MPIYTFINKETKEETEMMISYNEKEAILKSGKWEQKLSTPKFITQAGSTLRKAGTEWTNHLDDIKKKSGKGNTVNT